MAQRLCDELLLDATFPVSDVATHKHDDPNTGYRAIHLKGRYAACPDFGCEIQIRTALEDASAFVSRMELYKGQQELPSILLQLARVESQHLQAVDSAFDAIMKEVKRSEVTLPEPRPEEATPTPERVLERVEPASPLKGEAEAPQAPPETREEAATWEEFLTLSEEDLFIIQHHVSPERKQRFLDDFIERRPQAATTETLFRRVRAFQLDTYTPPNKGGLAAGFNVLIHKGPFVDGSRWLSMHARDFVVPLERHLLSRLDGELRSAMSGQFGAEVQRDPDAIVEAI